MSPRRPDLAALICDLAADYLASKGSGAHVAQLAPNVLERLVVELLKADPRLVQTTPGKWELATMRETRAAALTTVD
jgi:hypothetical protein